MNLKEAFRYQKFLDSMMENARMMLCARENCMTTVENHLRSAVIPSVSDEEIRPEPTDYIGNDKMLAFALGVVEEKQKLSDAISKAKATADIDIDAAIEVNKMRQSMAASIRSVLSNKASKRKGMSYGYYFNEVSGSQERYQYEVESVSTEAFDRHSFSDARRKLLADAEAASAAIDLAVVTVEVPYEPPYDVNASFDEVIASWVGKTTAEE